MNRSIVGLAILLLVGAFGATAGLEGTARRPGDSVAAHSLASETQALLGTWERLPGSGPWVRLEVRAVQAEWADVRVSWGRDATDARDRWIRSRAKVLPEGRLHVSSPFRMTFALSEDRRALVGARGGWEAGASAILTRIAPDSLVAAALPLPDPR